MSQFQNLILILQSLKNPKKAKVLQGFFKTGEGEYGEGDVFLGITVPKQRQVAKEFGNLSFIHIKKLLKSKIHEHRLVALLILIDQYERAHKEQFKKAIYQFYLSNTIFINNWDLVDLSADKIVGDFLRNNDKKILLKLVESQNLWERRIAMLATFNFIKHRRPDWTLKLAKMLLSDQHDLIHKAVGWMLREVGKRCGEKILIGFLNQHNNKMPRTMLRYAIERLPKKLRLKYSYGNQ